MIQITFSYQFMMHPVINNFRIVKDIDIIAPFFEKMQRRVRFFIHFYIILINSEIPHTESTGRATDASE